MPARCAESRSREAPMDSPMRAARADDDAADDDAAADDDDDEEEEDGCADRGDRPKLAGEERARLRAGALAESDCAPRSSSARRRICWGSWRTGRAALGGDGEACGGVCAARRSAGKEAAAEAPAPARDGATMSSSSPIK